MGKIRVEELAAQMGIGSKEVLFLLQSIGVDVKSPQAALDESTVLAILQGKTHAPKQLIVRDTEARAPRPQKSALSRIKIIEKPANAVAEEPEPAPKRAAEGRHARPAPPPTPPERHGTLCFRTPGFQNQRQHEGGHGHRRREEQRVLIL